MPNTKQATHVWATHCSTTCNAPELAPVHISALQSMLMTCFRHALCLNSRAHSSLSLSTPLHPSALQSMSQLWSLLQSMSQHSSPCLRTPLHVSALESTAVHVSALQSTSQNSSPCLSSRAQSNPCLCSIMASWHMVVSRFMLGSSHSMPAMPGPAQFDHQPSASSQDGLPRAAFQDGGLPRATS